MDFTKGWIGLSYESGVASSAQRTHRIPRVDLRATGIGALCFHYLRWMTILSISSPAYLRFGLTTNSKSHLPQTGQYPTLLASIFFLKKVASNEWSQPLHLILLTKPFVSAESISPAKGLLPIFFSFLTILTLVFGSRELAENKIIRVDLSKFNTRPWKMHNPGVIKGFLS